MARREQGKAFTLMELLVVLCLLSLMTGLTVIRLDGLGTQAKLRSAIILHGAVVELALVETRASGQSRLLGYEKGALVLHKPRPAGGSWKWDEGRPFALPAGVAVRQIHTRDDRIGPTLRIAGDGRIPEHGVIFETMDASLVARFHSLEEPRWKIVDRNARIDSWDAMTKLLELRP